MIHSNRPRQRESRYLGLLLGVVFCACLAACGSEVHKAPQTPDTHDALVRPYEWSLEKELNELRAAPPFQWSLTGGV